MSRQLEKPVRRRAQQNQLTVLRNHKQLLPGGEEQRVEGDTVRILVDGEQRETRRLPLLERGVRRAALAWQRWRLRRRGASV